ncbi:MAG: 2Fe-2S iron-sulfur cluster binding domain-containing protein [Myxococcales bacterium]|nr:2Fe-2S iron-sulfur cluster binding domain-containing protein [Myxococcales bacterium]
MGGVNPYLRQSAIPVAARPFRVMVEGMDEPIAVDPADLPYGRDGLPGSLLDILLHHGLELDHACGGVAACSTCHVYVQQGGKTCPPPEEAEEDMLDTAPALKPSSRLACQCVPSGAQDLVVAVPAWNRNRAKETD